MMNNIAPNRAPKLSSDEVLMALGLERRHSRVGGYALAVAIAAAGALVGAGVVLLRAGLLAQPSAAPAAAPARDEQAS